MAAQAIKHTHNPPGPLEVNALNGSVLLLIYRLLDNAARRTKLSLGHSSEAR